MRSMSAGGPLKASLGLFLFWGRFWVQPATLCW